MVRALAKTWLDFQQFSLANGSGGVGAVESHLSLHRRTSQKMETLPPRRCELPCLSPMSLPLSLPLSTSLHASPA